MRALENGPNEPVNFTRIVTEIYDGNVNLKNPNKIVVEAFTDNKEG